MFFFIDDLDRIDPETAIKVLELLKNIFDIKNCIFVLAIDYNIIIRGLKKKYEKYTDSYISFKDYFDKIIQLPFVMPIRSYKINNMLMNGLIEIDYFKQDELSVDNVMNLVNAVYLSIGNNPRKVKRLLNTVKLSFLLDRRNESLLVRSDWKLINIILLCIQQEFSYIYNFLLMEPDYTKWSDKIFSSYVFDFNQDQFLKNNIVYDEEWLTFIHKMCLNNNILKNYAYNICKVFTIMNSFIKNDVGYQLSKILSLSQSTNIDFVDVTYNGYEYNNNSFTQFIQGNRLISKISLNDGEKVLDVGCGNGLITIDLFQKNTNIFIDAIDISKSQIEIANKNRKSRSINSTSINFQVLNIFDINKTNYYDLIFSNASMHWILDYNKSYQLIYNALKKGGRIAIQQGGKGCYKGLHNIVKLAYQNLKLDDYYFNWTFPVFYPTANEMKSILQNIGFTDVEVFSETSDGKNYDSLPQDFANASLLYYYSRIPKKYHKLLKNEFLRLCSSQKPDLYTHRLFIYANKK